MHTSWSRWFAAATMTVALVACAQTDAGITTKVKSRFAADDTVKAYQIDVDTREKVVTLTGRVDTDAAKMQATRIARETEGVASVIDNITVSDAARTSMPPDRPAETVVTDASLTTAVKSKLLADPDVSGLKIDVDTMDGVVTLSGRVTKQSEKDEALRLARETDGVKSVTDKLTIGS